VRLYDAAQAHPTSTRLSRRRLLVPVVGLAVTSILAACGGPAATTQPPTVAPSPAATASPATAPVATAVPTAAVPATSAATVTPALVQPATVATANPTAPPAPAAATKPAPAANLAPELATMEWFNSPPLTLAELRGQAVLLVFWSDI
jgi:hypothetical protein